MSISNDILGQVVSYMREFDLRYGFLSTYQFTVFIKRVDDFCFHLSLPISHDATNPSLRQCFAGFAMIAAENPTYEEAEDIDTRRVGPFFFFARYTYVN